MSERHCQRVVPCIDQCRGGGGVGGSTTGSLCPGVQALSGTACRTDADCGPMISPSNVYTCTEDPSSVSACGVTCDPAPPHQCNDDSGCPTGFICGSVTASCCDRTGTQCMPACTPGSCASAQRCSASGDCEAIPCSDGFLCPANTQCAPASAGADGNGCAPQSCAAGYACGSGLQCADGARGADAHGCVPSPCSQTGCPVNYTCQPNSTSGGCVRKTCAIDGDCDCGYCLSNSCADRLDACARLPV
jgi:hypothetical protein